MSKNVLYITSRTDMGGGPKHLLQLINNVDKRKYNLFVACPQDKPFYDHYLSLIPSENFFKLKHRVFNFKYLYGLYKFCIKNNIHVIHSHGRCAGVFSRLLKVFLPKIKVVHTYHGLNVPQDGGFLLKIKKNLYVQTEKIFLYLTDNCIFVSKGEADTALSLGMKKAIKKGDVILNGVKVPSVVIDKNIDDEVCIVVISRFDFQKNTDLLVSILTEIESSPVSSEKKIIVNILGEGEDSYKITNFKNQKNKIEVHLNGNVNDSESYYCKSNFVLNTSRWEGLPLSVIESMSYGCIPLLTDVVGNTDIISDTMLEGNLLKSPKDALNRIQKYCLDKDRYHSDMIESHNIVKNNFNELKMCEKTFDLYD